MDVDQTIVAVACGPGQGARGIVRVSGASTRIVLGTRIPEYTLRPAASVGCFDLGDGHLLPVQILGFAGPRSYTGEDAAELLLPGNPELIERVVRRLLACDQVRMAEPGEFSARAYLNGRLTLEQARAVADTIAATTDAELCAARGAADTAWHGTIRRWSEECTELLAMVEAGIDFSDEVAVTAMTCEEVSLRTASLIASVRKRLGGALGNELVEWGARVVLCGRPNAGKSTLFNALVGRERSVASAVAGTTRDAICEPLAGTLEGLVLVDLPGVGELDDGLAVATREIDRAAVVLWCDDRGIFEPSAFPHLPTSSRVVRVRTKADRPGPHAGEDIAVCVLDGFNVPRLRELVLEAAWAGQSQTANCHQRSLLPRHRRAVAEFCAALVAVESECEPRRQNPPELLAAGLRQAHAALAPLTGDVGADAVLGRIFSRFCIGK